ncbi:hypothetical protein [Helicobacter labacensis]|uniref:hypothetical protein n=1 Tax=Helicobacter labacensis TaxID=2316079 RepID=UPI000EAC8EAD|nr:hypothetical protein [Helicobacter labacensis]
MRALVIALLGLWLGLGVLQGAEVLNTSLIHRAKRAKAKKPTPSKKRNPKLAKRATKAPTKPISPKAPSVSARWIYSSAFLTVYFSDGHYKQGYGLLLQNGNYLSVASLVFDEGMYAQTIMARMQDDSAPMLICVARLHVKAIDHNRGLSLLGTYSFTNDYCQTRPESYYHARIYKKYAQDLLAYSHAPNTNTLYYPQVDSKDAFEVQRLHNFHDPSLQNLPLGRPLFNAQGVFMGVLDGNQDKLKVIKRGVVLDFLRALQKRRLL